MNARESLRAFLESERAEIEGLTARMPPEIAAPYFERIDGLIAEYDRLHAALETIGLPAHVPKGFAPLDWWQQTACKRGEIARDALGVSAEELIAKQWHDHVEATR